MAQGHGRDGGGKRGLAHGKNVGQLRVPWGFGMEKAQDAMKVHHQVSLDT